MFITLTYTNLPLNCYEIHLCHFYPNKWFALEIVSDSTHLSYFNKNIDRVWDYKVMFSPSTRANRIKLHSGLLYRSLGLSMNKNWNKKGFKPPGFKPPGRVLSQDSYESASQPTSLSQTNSSAENQNQINNPAIPTPTVANDYASPSMIW